MSPAQCRAARALLNWSQDQLAVKATVSVTTLRNFERGATAPVANNLSAIRAALEAAGVEFTNGDAPGVRLRRKPGGADQGGPEADDGLPEPLAPAVKG